MTTDTPIWSPSQERIRSSNLWRFLEEVSRDHPGIGDYASLYRWSIEQPKLFWSAIWSFCGLLGDPGELVVDDWNRMPGARWFPEAVLNFAQNLIREPSEDPAIVAWNELGRYAGWSRRDLAGTVSGLAAGLRSLGIGPGDRVAGYLPNIPHTVAAMLAAASVGATWSSCSPDFGVSAARDRLGQITPRVLFAAPSYQYAGKHIDCRERILDLRQEIPSVETIVVVPYMDANADLSGERLISWEDFQTTDPCEPLQLPFNHPLYVLYSSGTTGLPKCIVHGAGGTLLQHLKELVLHTDIRKGDSVFYYTTCGWMMWNWLVSALAAEATIVLYDGSPFHPEPDVLLEMAEAEEVAVFGASAKYISMAEKQGVEAGGRNLAPLRSILSTGSALAPASYDYVYSSLKKDVCLSSISGGTDIVSCFALGSPTEPVYKGELQVRGLGMAVEIFDANGTSVVGRPGELVCTQAFPSMPLFFWDDPDQSKYLSAYFNRYPGVWTHGDWAELTERGGLIIYGRSDATLNPGGVRIGTAEIYRQVEALDEVLEAVVVGQEWESDTRVVLFVKLAKGSTLTPQLADLIKARIRSNASPHHVPRKILQVHDIPRTISGKISELAVRNVIHGRPVSNVDALANPDSLEEYRHLDDLHA